MSQISLRAKLDDVLTRTDELKDKDIGAMVNYLRAIMHHAFKAHKSESSYGEFVHIILHIDTIEQARVIAELLDWQTAFEVEVQS